MRMYMKKYDEVLFKNGEIFWISGTTRKPIWGYEEMGLLTPVV